MANNKHFTLNGRIKLETMLSGGANFKFIASAFSLLASYRGHNDSRSVTNIFGGLFTTLEREKFCNIFKVLLTDNGSEFSNPAAIELNADNIRRTRIYYCDPSAPYPKEFAERNHEFIRCFIPKGKSLDDYTQRDISLMMDHKNSYCTFLHYVLINSETIL